MSDEERKRSKSRALRFAVTSALLIGPAGGCGPEPVEHNTPAPEPIHGNAPAPDDESPEGNGPQLPDTVEQRSTNSPVQVVDRPTNAPMQETPPPSDGPPPVVGSDPLEGVVVPSGTNTPGPGHSAPDPVEESPEPPAPPAPHTGRPRSIHTNAPAGRGNPTDLEGL